MNKFREGDRVRVVSFDEAGDTGLIYVGEDDPRGKVGVVAREVREGTYHLSFDLPNWAYLPQFFYENELELDET